MAKVGNMFSKTLLALGVVFLVLFGLLWKGYLLNVPTEEKIAN